VAQTLVLMCPSCLSCILVSLTRAVARGYSSKNAEGPGTISVHRPFGRSLDLGSTKGRLSSTRRARYRRNSARCTAAHIEGRRRARSSSAAFVAPSDALSVCAASILSGLLSV
jgi:hypothetical protein